MKNNVVEITRADVLISEKNKCLKSIMLLELDIKILERTDGKMVVAREPGPRDDYGNIMSYKGITAKELLERKRKELADTKENAGARMKVIDILLKDENTKKS